MTQRKLFRTVFIPVSRLFSRKLKNLQDKRPSPGFRCSSADGGAPDQRPVFSFSLAEWKIALSVGTGTPLSNYLQIFLVAKYCSRILRAFQRIMPSRGVGLCYKNTRQVTREAKRLRRDASQAC